jgi:hypothetical protein
MKYNNDRRILRGAPQTFLAVQDSISPAISLPSHQLVIREEKYQPAISRKPDPQTVVR